MHNPKKNDRKLTNTKTNKKSPSLKEEIYSIQIVVMIDKVFKETKN